MLQLGTETSQSLTGRVAGRSSSIAIEYGPLIQTVDDLLAPSQPEGFVAPGLIDLQVNGFAGIDYNNPAAAASAIAESIRTMFTTGVTRFFPTVITGSEAQMIASLRNLAKAKKELGASPMREGAAMEAFHVEGPHISPEDGPRGAHPIEHVRPPDLEEFKRWQDAAEGNVRLVTISPEWPEMPAYVSAIVRTGVVASVGHTKASREQIRAVVEAGATMSTHLGNAGHPELPKTGNYIWDQLAEDRLTASFIVDGIHLPESFFRASVRAKGAEHSVLVSDAVMPAMCKPGPYKLGEVEVQLQEDGRVVKRGTERLAGSALRMDHAVGNAVKFSGLPLSTVLAMASANAARVGRIAGRQRGLSPGDRADFVRYSWDAGQNRFTVSETIVSGVSVYRA